MGEKSTMAYIDVRIEQALNEGNRQEWLRLIRQLAAAKKFLPLNDAEFEKTRAAVFENFEPYMGVREDLPAMIGANAGMVTVSYVTFQSSVVGVFRFEDGLSRVLLITSAGLALTAMGMSSLAVLAAADFVPAAAPACLLFAKYLNLAGRKRGEFAENELLGLENPEEGRPGIAVKFWRFLKRRYRKWRNRENEENSNQEKGVCDRPIREIEMSADEPSTVSDCPNPIIEITEGDPKVILGPIVDLITL